MAAHTPFDVNDVLVDQTMVCEASRLLLKRAGRPRPARAGAAYMGTLDGAPSDVERLLHLSMLLDALALHDRLYVLKAELPEDAPSLELRSLLLAKGVIRELPTAPYAAGVGRDFRAFLDSLISIGQVNSLQDLINFNRGALTKERAGRAETADNVVNAVEMFLGGGGARRGSSSSATLSRFLKGERTGRQTLRSLSERKGRDDRWRFERDDLLDRPLYVLGREMLSDLDAFDSGHAGRGVSHLRTFVYWRVSEHARVVLYPSCRRAAQIDLFTDHLRASVSEQVYGMVARAFGTTVETVYADEAPIPLYLPPTLAIFLDIYQRAADLPGAVDEFREHFAPLRREFRRLEREMAEAPDLGRRIDAKAKILAALKSVASEYELKDDATLESVLSLAEAAAKPFTNPLDPTKYSKELLLKPLGWIAEWWRKRPLRTAFKLKRRLREIEGYERLATSALGVEFDPRERELFVEHYNSYLALYQRKPPTPPKEA